MGNRKISAYLKMCALSLWDRGWQVEDIVDGSIDIEGKSLSLECHLRARFSQSAIFFPARMS